MGLGHLARTVVGLFTYPVDPTEHFQRLLPFSAAAELVGRIVEIKPESPSAVSITIRPGRSWAGHRPGQYVRLGVEINGVRHWRAYSITSRVGDANLQVLVKGQNGGLVSDHLVHRLRPGDPVWLEQAAGDFCLPEPKPAKILFLAAGSGITPILAMLRNHILSDATLVYSAPDEEQMIASDELRIRAKAGQLELIERMTRAEGRFDPSDLDELVPDWRERQLWACGPGEFLNAVSAYYENHGCADLLHVERFRAERNFDLSGEGGEVTWTAQGRQLTSAAGPDQTLLEAGEANGLPMKFGCRMGICHGCLVKLDEGAVRDVRTGKAVLANEDDPETIQACVTVAAGDCRITL